jgi:sporulation protein YlmC with PRC-barrel domain
MLLIEQFRRLSMRPTLNDRFARLAFFWNAPIAPSLTSVETMEKRMRLIPVVILACTLVSPLAMAQNPTTSPSAAAAPVPAVGHWRASKLVGVNVYNEQNEKIGDLNDVIIDSTGKVEGVVIGVGGFLGAGERNVMMPLDKIKFSNESDKTTTGSTGSGSRQWYPDRAVVSATKDQLKAMTEFKY